MYYGSRKENRKYILAHSLGCHSDELEYLGSGNFADAFLYKGKVHKVTDDPDDFIMANKMIKVGHKFPNFVKVFKTAPIEVHHDDYTENLYLIVSEKIEQMSHGDKIVNEIWEDLTDINSSSRCIECGLPVRVSDNIKESWERKGQTELLNTLISQMQYIYRMYKAMGLKTWDNHNKNLGFVDGKIKIFDMGFSIKKSKYSYNKRRKIVYSYQTEITCI
jgi:hypothetical protein